VIADQMAIFYDQSCYAPDHTVWEQDLMENTAPLAKDVPGIG